MDVTLTVRHDSIPDSIRDYAEERAGRFERLFDRIHKTEVILDHDGNRYCCEIKIAAIKGQVFTVKVDGGDWRIAIDDASEKMDRLLAKFNEKLKSKNRVSGRHAPVPIPPPNDVRDVDEPSYRDIVEGD